MSDDDAPIAAKRPMRLAASTKVPARRSRKIRGRPLVTVPAHEPTPPQVGGDPFAGLVAAEEYDSAALPSADCVGAATPVADLEPQIHVMDDPFSPNLSLPFVVATVNAMGRPQVLQVGDEPVQVLREFHRGSEQDALAHARQAAARREIMMIEGIQPRIVVDALLEGLWLGRSDAARKA